MSLDVYLCIPNPQTAPKREAIFVRRDGATVEVTRNEWDALYPNQQPATITVGGDCDDCAYTANITHNLGRMAEAAGIYQHLWRPEELGLHLANDLIKPLERGLAALKTEPERFRQFDAPNGWGKYEQFVLFVENYLAACRESPDATIRVSR